LHVNRIKITYLWITWRN